MKVAPLSVRLHIALYAATPLLVFWLASAELPSLTALVPTVLLLLAGVPIGVGLYRVRRKALVALFVHTFFTAGIAVVDIAFYDGLLWPMTLDLFVVGGLALRFLSRDARSPYFSDDGRGFRLAPRQEIHLPVELSLSDRNIVGNTYDLSRSGAYIECSVAGLEKGTRCFLSIKMRDKELRCQVRLVSVNPEGLGVKPQGVGIQFINVNRADSRGIEGFLSRARQHPRKEVKLPVEVTAGQRSLSAETSNVSLGGCFIRDDSKVFHPGDKVMVKLELYEHDELDCLGEVSWLSPNERDEPGLALRFTSLSKVDKERLAARLEEEG